MLKEKKMDENSSDEIYFKDWTIITYETILAPDSNQQV